MASLLSEATLRSFSLLEQYSQAELERLVESLTVQTANPGARIIARGSDDHAHYLLLQGRVRLIAGDGRVTMVAEASPAARRPLSQLRPRMYDVHALTGIKYLRIEEKLLEGLHKEEPEPDPDSEISELQMEQEIEGELCFYLYQDLNTDTLVLPSLPDVALRVSAALEDEVSNAQRIAALVQSDPAITAKLIKVANSALYMGREPVSTCAAAVVRLGIETTHKLVTSFAMSELFKVSSKVLQDRMQRAWRHSIEIGALCFVLGKRLKGFDPEQAMLAGLLHDIGTVAVLNYAEKFPDIAESPHQVEVAINALHGQIGGMILRKWRFPDEYVMASTEGDSWHRDLSKSVDLCDLVVVAQLHKWGGIHDGEAIPAVEDSNSYTKLGLSEVTEDHKLVLLEEEEKLIREIEIFLGM